jgi:signal transduction histidine kinase
MTPMRWLPKTLSGRMTLILVAGLLAAQLASLALHWRERAGLIAPGHVHPGMPAFDALPLQFVWHVSLTLAAVIAVTLIAVRWVTRPLEQLSAAATRLAGDLDAAPLDETGPAEVRRAAAAFNAMQQRLRKLVVERSRALAAVSHDLRTPLTRMRLRAELVDDPQLQAKLNADIDAMQGMVDGLLGYLRGIEDAEPVQPMDIEALLESIVEDEQALGRPVSLLKPAAGARRSDPFTGRLSILRRAIGNLIGNAVAHGRTATVRFEDSIGELRLIVEDDGPGIPEAELQRVMEPYVRLDAARALDTGGVGLGLAIVRDAAASHGGELRLANRAEGGLRATLVLPRT